MEGVVKVIFSDLWALIDDDQVKVRRVPQVSEGPIVERGARQRRRDDVGPLEDLLRRAVLTLPQLPSQRLHLSPQTLPAPRITHQPQLSLATRRHKVTNSHAPTTALAGDTTPQGYKLTRTNRSSRWRHGTTRLPTHTHQPQLSLATRHHKVTNSHAPTTALAGDTTPQGYKLTRTNRSSRWRHGTTRLQTHTHQPQLSLATRHHKVTNSHAPTTALAGDTTPQGYKLTRTNHSSRWRHDTTRLQTHTHQPQLSLATRHHKVTNSHAPTAALAGDTAPQGYKLTRTNHSSRWRHDTTRLQTHTHQPQLSLATRHHKVTNSHAPTTALAGDTTPQGYKLSSDHINKIDIRSITQIVVRYGNDGNVLLPQFTRHSLVIFRPRNFYPCTAWKYTVVSLYSPPLTEEKCFYIEVGHMKRTCYRGSTKRLPSYW